MTTVLRFVLAGAANTLFSIAVYQALLFVVNSTVAYIVAYAAGIVFAYVVYARRVFDAALSLRRFVLFALFYLGSGGVGTLINNVLIDKLALHARLAIFATVVIMLPINYFGSRWCLRAAAAKMS